MNCCTSIVDVILYVFYHIILFSFQCFINYQIYCGDVFITWTNSISAGFNVNLDLIYGM
jgi:hypothetical protein